MTTAGILTMLISVLVVTFLFIWCTIRIFKTPGETKKLKGIELHTPDQENNEE